MSWHATCMSCKEPGMHAIVIKFQLNAKACAMLHFVINKTRVVPSKYRSIHFTIDLHIWLFDLPGCGHWLKWSLRGSRAPCQGSIPNAACSETSWTLLTPAVLNTSWEIYSWFIYFNGFAKVFSSNQRTRFNFKLCSIFSPPRLVGLPVCWARTSPARSSNHQHSSGLKHPCHSSFEWKGYLSICIFNLC